MKLGARKNKERSCPRGEGLVPGVATDMLRPGRAAATCPLPAGAGLPREALAPPVPGVERQPLLAKASLPRKH